MVDLISRAAAIDAIKPLLYCGDFVSTLIQLPAVDAVPVEWLRQEAMKDDGLINSVIRGLLMKWQKEQEAR